MKNFFAALSAAWITLKHWVLDRFDDMADARDKRAVKTKYDSGPFDKELFFQPSAKSVFWTTVVRYISPLIWTAAWFLWTFVILEGLRFWQFLASMIFLWIAFKLRNTFIGFKNIGRRKTTHIDVEKFMRPAALEIRKQWPNLMIDAGFADSVEDVERYGPFCIGMKMHSRGIIFRMRVRTGQDSNDIVNARGRIASAMGYDNLILVHQTDNYVDFVLAEFDPLETPRHLEVVLREFQEHLGADGMAKNQKVIVGRTESLQNVYLDFGHAAHTAEQGGTRSGKTAALLCMATQLNLNTVNTLMIGFDPTRQIFIRSLRDGWMSTNNTQLASKLRFGAVPEIAPGDAVPALDWLEARNIANQISEELENRLGALTAMEKVDKFDPLDTDFPVLVVIFEEFTDTLNLAKAFDTEKGLKGSDSVHGAIKALHTRVMLGGAKVNFRAITIAQRFEANTVGGSERANMTQRISMKVDNRDSIKMLHNDVSDELATRLFDSRSPGSGLVTGLTDRTEWFRGDMHSYRRYVELTAQAKRENPKYNFNATALNALPDSDSEDVTENV